MTRLSRRELLAAVGAAGGLGMATGLGTAAYYHDFERFPANRFRAGSLDLEIDCTSGNCGITGDGAISIDLDGIHPGASGQETFTLTHLGNPSWLWLGTSCPETSLASAIEVRIAIDRDCDGLAERTFSGTLRDIQFDLSEGVRVGDDCFGSNEQTCVTIDWAFPDSSDAEEYRGESASFELDFYAVQCRHNDGSLNPVPIDEPCVEDGRGISFIEVWTCALPAPDCQCELLGKLELDDAYAEGCTSLSTDGLSENHLMPGTYDLPVDDECEDTGYDLVVTSTRENAQGETTAVAFELVDDAGDPGPDLCLVRLKAGPEVIEYGPADLGERSNDTGGDLSTTGV